MIDRSVLLNDLKRQVSAVESDLATQVREISEVGTRLRGEYNLANKVNRTAATWNAWLDERITQVAAAWVLGTVFVRFAEDNRLIPEPYVSGPEVERRDLAKARYGVYAETDEDPTYCGWLKRAFAELGAGRVGRLLFHPDHNPLFQIPLSHNGARSLVEFWRGRNAAGALVHDFTDPLNDDGTQGWDTRFLGDLYQGLSESARKTYALFQTPEFVEEFVLDRTMDPAVREFGHQELRMIDPTCGSGNFVLGAFRRLVKLRAEEQPGGDAHEQVRAALDSVHGVDTDPSAVTITRFRLLVAAMAAADIRTFAEAGRYDWPIHLAVGDSLIKDRQIEPPPKKGTPGGPLASFAYATEDAHEHEDILEQGRYHVVVGSPPHVTMKDRHLSALYRRLYDVCTGKYSLSVPFAQRFFELARQGDADGLGYGMVGQLTANSFMNREFGTKLVEEYFAHQVELTEVIDTSGVYIPGSGTPTVILVGRRREGKKRSKTVRTVRSVQGEPFTPEDPGNGLVWRAITNQIDTPDTVSQWVSVDDLDRDRYFGRQPWILADGGLETVEQIHAEGREPLRTELSREIGSASSPGQEDAFVGSPEALRRLGVTGDVSRPLVLGEAVRDWDAHCAENAIAPYGEDLEPLPFDDKESWARLLWGVRSQLRPATDFDDRTRQGSVKPWWSWQLWVPEVYRTPLSITFAESSTHNHFVLDRGGKVFKQTAPVIKLREDAGEEDHLRLLGLLNSSVVCFWLKINCHDKGTRGEGTGSEEWERLYQLGNAGIEHLPLPDERPAAIGTVLDALAQRLASSAPSATSVPAATATPASAALQEARDTWESVRAQMVFLQEELDWQVYSLYGLHEDLRVPDSVDIRGIALGERAFEIVLARRVARGEASGEWFKRHGSTPVTEIPPHWPEAYREVVQKRIDAMESSRTIGMVERPEYKRRWGTEGWDALRDKALRSWLLDRIEARGHWYGDNGRARPLSLSHLVDVLSRDEDFASVARVHAPHQELADVVAGLVKDEHVPFVAALRHKASGLRKRTDWEETWELQREEDAAPDEHARRELREKAKVPPKYTSADFLQSSFWKARGRLDVPKERFVSYGSTAAGTPDLYGWAGWDHREQAQALVTHVTSQSLSVEETVPFLAGLLELQPWLSQWHGEFDAMYGDSPAGFFSGYRRRLQDEHGLTDDDLRAWRPAPAVIDRRGDKKK